MVIVFKAALCSALDEPLNSLKTYAPRAAPSATAAMDSGLVDERENVAAFVPARARDAAPAARRKVSCE